MIDTITKLKGSVQDYAWGGFDYIPTLLNIPNVDRSPFAEYWIGIHPRGEANIMMKSGWEPLSNHVQLPFLLKMLDVHNMLSIQCHPTKRQAEIGFANENSEGIPLDAHHRIFKDDNHKPELMVAESDFWLLHGFNTLDVISETIDSIPEFAALKTMAGENIKTFYSQLMTMDDAQVDSILTPLKERLIERDISDKNSPDYWAKKAFGLYGNDKGIFSIYFFNLVYLQKGEGIYQEAGIPHAYLEGKNIEIMANSDNVFRAGLTPKYMDIDALLAHMDFNAVVPKVVTPISIHSYENTYKSPAKEFELSVIELNGHTTKRESSHYECLLVLDGNVRVVEGSSILELSKGDSIIVPSNKKYSLNAYEKSKIVRALVPTKN